MSHALCTPNATRASVTKRELRALAKRLCRSERPELRAIARTLDKAIAGELVPHVPACSCGGETCWRRSDACPHGATDSLCWLRCEACEHDPLTCPDCQPLAWMVWAIGVAFPSDAPEITLGLPHTEREDWAAEILRRAREGDPPPAIAWWTGTCEDLNKFRAAFELTATLTEEIRFGNDQHKARAAQKRAIIASITPAQLRNSVL